MSNLSSTQRRDLRTPVAAFRTALIVVCALLALERSRDADVLVVLLVLTLAAWWSYRSERVAGATPYFEAFLVAAAVPFTGGSDSALLPYLLAPGISLGLTAGAREIFLASGGASGLLLVGLLRQDMAGSGDYVIVCAQWTLLSLAVGLVATWSHAVVPSLAHPDDYDQVRRLLERVRALNRHLPGSLDSVAAAVALLERSSRVAPHDLGAVLVRPGEGDFVPLAVTGASRVPWRTPLAADGPLRSAWTTQRPTVDRRREDPIGRRHGSTVLALPLLSAHGPFGLVILQAADPDAFDADTVDQLRDLVERVAPQLEAALLFEEVRLEASVEERDRLAREMHDGIAQELAYVGYQLDELRLRSSAVDADLAEQTWEIRQGLTALMADLRLSITDLRTTLRPDRGIGAALSTYLRAVCAGRDVVLNLSLQETAFRLPADEEACLLRAAQVFAQEVRHTQGVRELTVRLVVDPPSASLHLTCDAPLPGLRLDGVRASVRVLGGEVSESQGAVGQPLLTMMLKGGNDDERHAGGRPPPHPARTEASVRAD